MTFPRNFAAEHAYLPDTSTVWAELADTSKVMALTAEKIRREKLMRLRMCCSCNQGQLLTQVLRQLMHHQPSNLNY
jgi:hypothetical protein